MTQNTPKPQLDFIGIGFTKAGSTWIYKLLEEHPEVQVSKTKETNFFVNQDLEARPQNIKYLEEFFEGEKGKVRGEFSPMYINKDKALKNIKKFYPDIKLLAILRNPVDKRISEVMYNYRFKEDMENVDFNEVIRERFKNARPGSIYLDHLRKWMDHFPPENFHIMILEEMIADPRQGVSDLYRFLGVGDSYQPQAAEKKANVAHGFRHPKLQKKLRNAHQRVKKYPRLARTLKKASRALKLKQRILEWNKKAYERPAISDQTRKLLFDMYKEEIGELEKLLDKDLSVWRQ